MSARAFGLALGLGLGAAWAGPLEELEAWDQKVRAADVQVAARERKLEAANAQVLQAQQEVTRTEEALSQRRSRTRQNLHALYKLERRGLARLIFGAESPADLRKRIHLLLSLLGANASRLAEYRALLTAKQSALGALQAEQATLAALKAEADAQRAALAEELVQRRAWLRQLAAPALQTARSDLLRIQDAAGSALSSPPPPNRAPDSPPGTPESTPERAPSAEEQIAAATRAFRANQRQLPAPAPGKVTRGFGAWTNPADGTSGSSPGIDIAAPLGTPFRAVAAGTVTRSGHVKGYGQLVIVEHGRYTTLYAHANGLRVAQGQVVEAGALLGLVGNSGILEDIEGGLLHFEVRYNGTPQDPFGWLTPGALTCAPGALSCRP